MTRGFVRIFIVFSLAWVSWFGWQAYDANKQVSKAEGWLLTIEQDLKLGRQPAWDKYETYSWKLEQQRRLESSIQTGLLGEAGGLLVLLAVSWIVRGFKQPTSKPKSRPYLEQKIEDIEQRKQQRATKPASTLGLIISIIFLPVLWLMDPGAMSNYWASRNKEK